MAECKQCGKEYVAKRNTSAYCGPKCKQDFYRNRMKPVTVTSETLKPKSVTVSDSVTNAKPVTVTESKSSVTGVCCVDHTCNFTGKMTVMERLFYLPASKLGRGETNFVSLPGRACYGVV